MEESARRSGISQDATTFVHKFVAGAATTKRTLVLLHGTGGDEDQLIDLGQTLDPEANLLAIRGNSLEEGHHRFFRRFSEGVFDEDDLRAQAVALNRFLAWSRMEYFLLGKYCAVGYSNGANIAAAMLVMGLNGIDEAVLFRAMSPFLSPEWPDLTGKRIFMANGDQDPMASTESAMQLAAGFREAGATVTARLAHAGHGLTPEEVQLALAWLG